MTDKPIFFGASYYPDHWPEADWERDLQLMRDCGLTGVRFGEFSWSWFEPRDAEFDFTAYDRFMALAEKVGLNVILCTTTCNPPPWFFRKYPDARVMDQKGRRHLGHRHMTNYNHFGAYADARRATVKLAEHYKDHPALLGWQIDNELTAGESTHKQQVYDYHPLTIARYREYLQEKYESLDALNDAWLTNFWSSRYSTWGEIDPPRIGENIAPSPAMWLEWTRFRDLNIARLGHWQIEWLRSVRDDFWIGTNVPEASPWSSVWLAQDYWLLCQGMDFIGTDLYVNAGSNAETQRILAYSCDVIRSAAQAAGAQFGMLEAQAGSSNRPWRQTFAAGDVGPAELQANAETFAAHGSQFIYWFRWRPARNGAEFGGGALPNIDGSRSARTDALPTIMNAAESARGCLADRPVAYIHYSQDTLRLLNQFDPDPTVNALMWGWHSLIMDLGYRVEFLNDDTLWRLGANPPGPLFMPFSAVMSEDLCAFVAQIAQEGPAMIAGPHLAYFDEYANIYLQAPGAGLANIFGFRTGQYRTGQPLNIPDLPEAHYPHLLQAEIMLSGAEAIDHNQTGNPVALKYGNTRYLAFDLGTLYHYATLDERREIVDWFFQHVIEGVTL